MHGNKNRKKKVKFSEVLKRQIQEKTKDAVIQLIKEKEDLVQDSTQELEQEVEEMIRLEISSEGSRKPMKVRIKSQVAVEEIMTRKGKLANDTEHKDIWIKRDMNLEEREKEKVLRSEGKEKKTRKGWIEKKNFYWRVLDMRLKN
ncbi:hypothetical protein E2C01_032370 [Portunus trituberculatus]|uniref:Uncharacterized protein n=1 Tax=Portunus trituberculatus TaxID=210409 RepID=A0A5B7F2L4_PORTR|nr:hypothetical protein [Portunus trituberculatus]